MGEARMLERPGGGSLSESESYEGEKRRDVEEFVKMEWTLGCLSRTVHNVATYLVLVH